MFVVIFEEILGNGGKGPAFHYGYSLPETEPVILKMKAAKLRSQLVTDADGNDSYPRLLPCPGNSAVFGAVYA